MVIVIAGGATDKRGFTFKSGGSIEVANKTSHLVFEKTGTLTRGQLTVVVENLISANPGSDMSLLLGFIGNIKTSQSLLTHMFIQLSHKGTWSPALQLTIRLQQSSVFETCPGTMHSQLP